MTTTVDLETRAERVRMALAEAGYPDPGLVWIGPSHVRRGAWSILVSGVVPKEVMRCAFKVTGPVFRCDPCWWADRACLESDHADDCDGTGWES